MLMQEKPWRRVEIEASKPGEWYGQSSWLRDAVDPREQLTTDEPLWPVIAVLCFAALLLLALTQPWTWL